MKKTQTQQELLRAAREKLKLNNAELAERLGVSESLMLAWLSPSSSAKHRPMRQPARLLLAAILADAKRKKK